MLLIMFIACAAGAALLVKGAIDGLEDEDVKVD